MARHAGASLTLRARGSLPYNRLEVAFLKQPGGGRAEVQVDGEPSGQIDLNGAADERATLDLQKSQTGRHGFHDISVRSLSDAPVTVTGVEVARDGDGVSYISLGFPGATVQVLEKLASTNLADDCGSARTSSCSLSAPTKASTTRSTSRPIPHNTSRS